MNKTLFCMIAAGAALAFTACSNDDDIKAPATDNGASHTISLALNNSGDGMTTRAGRPLVSSAAANNVDKAQMVLYKKVDGSWEKQTPNTVFEVTDGLLAWNGPVGEGTPGTTGREETRTIRLKNLSDGEYKMVAYAYNGTLPYSLNESNTNFSATVTSETVEELFAGAAEFVVTNGKIQDGVKVTMNRQVAGVLAYFKDVPVLKANAQGVITPVKYVKVYASAKTNGFDFIKFGSDAKYSGRGQKTGKTEIISFDMADCNFPEGQTYDQYVAAATTATLFPGMTATGANTQTVDGSILKGVFATPYASKVNATTLTVELQDKNGATLREWRVKDKGQAGYIYDLQRNNFYSIGAKDKGTDTDGDDPQPLNTDNELLLTLNDAWDVIYDLGLTD